MRLVKEKTCPFCDRSSLVKDVRGILLSPFSRILPHARAHEFPRHRRIAHRLHSIMNVDQIVVLEGGRVAETGDHASLLAASGHNAHLWQEQHIADSRQIA